MGLVGFVCCWLLFGCFAGCCFFYCRFFGFLFNSVAYFLFFLFVVVGLLNIVLRFLIVCVVVILFYFLLVVCLFSCYCFALDGLIMVDCFDCVSCDCWLLLVFAC